MESVKAVENHTEVIKRILEIIEYFAVAFEVFAVIVITLSIAYATYEYFTLRHHSVSSGVAYRAFRGRLGSGLLLGLEILVAADVVRTVALEPTLESAGVLGLLVVIRIALSWSLVVEIEHRWPWQPEKPESAED